ncbi:TPR-like protein [Trametopsis cervina]|nr:TPR-like protein [Trametopsis cervina]
MGRTRTKSKKIRPPVAENAAESAKPPPVASLLEKAQGLIVQCDYPLAERFIKRALEREPKNADAREMLAVVLLETGEIDDAREIFQTLVPPHPDAPSPPPSSAYLYLAQLSDDEPQAALQHYQSAVDLMTSQLKGKERAVDTSGAEDDDAEIRRNIVRALVGMVEIWMDPSHDLCFEPAAEKTCEDLLQLALQTDPGNTEALQALASVRLSQQRPDDAKVYLEQAWVSWKDLDQDESRVPPIPTRISLVKMFLELELFEPALMVLTGIIEADDQEVEAWYLEGWCFFLMAEKAQENGGKLDELSWEQLGRDARDCLETCTMLHETQEHPDTPLLEHAHELIGKLDGMGIQPSPEDEQDDEGDGEWEDADSGDEDVEMS